MKKNTYIDLFSGAGGLTIGFGRNNFHLVLANDIAQPALETFKKNLSITHPKTSINSVILGDIMDLYHHLGTEQVQHDFQGHMVVQTKKEIELRRKTKSIKDDELILSTISKIKEIDVLVGGPPCQGFSIIGRAKKSTLEERTKGFIDDPRNQLFKYYLKFAERFRPKIVLIENVKGLASASRYRDLVEKTLRDTGIGYNVSSEVLNAKDFGIPQNRERIFFIGIRNDIHEKHEINASDVFSSIMELKERAPILKDVLFDLPQISANPKPNNYKVQNEIPFSSSKSFGKNISEMYYTELVDKNLKSNFLDKINTYRGKLITPVKLFNHKSRFHNDRDLYIFKHLVEGKYLNDPENKKALSKVTYGVIIDENGDKKVKGFGDKYYKLNGNSVSKTIIAHLETDGNSYVHPGKKPRSISPREAARIQSFPDWYLFTGSTRNQFKQIGNAVPPLLADVFARVFKDVLKNV